MESEDYQVYSDPAFKRFVRQVGKTPFVTPEEEIDLHARLSVPETRDAAVTRLVEAHMRLVLAVAANFHGRGISVQDLVQEGVFGLYDAVEKFDPARGRFKTYAAWWVRTRISDHLNKQSRTVRLPQNVLLKLSKLKKLQAEYARNGIIPSSSALADALGVDMHKLGQLEISAFGISSLDAPIEDGEDLTLADTLADTSNVEPGEDLDRQKLIAALHEALDDLNERERDIVLRRFGFVGDSQTLEEVRVSYGITRERVRQIEVKAIGKLRAAGDRKLLRLARG